MFSVNIVKSRESLFKNKNVVAWVMMISVIAMHVFDETVTEFLPFYNQLVFNLRESIGFFPMPTFSFGLWLGGLIFSIAVGFALTPIVHHGGRIIRMLTTVLGILMTLNACTHMIGSIYMGRLLPGFWSSPFLLFTAAHVVVRGFIGSSWARRIKIRSEHLRSRT
jgi:hypothetical protein